MRYKNIIIRINFRRFTGRNRLVIALPGMSFSALCRTFYYVNIDMLCFRICISVIYIRKQHRHIFYKAK
jgi:hypothetical protein